MERGLNAHVSENQPSVKSMLFLIEGDVNEAASRLKREGVQVTDIFDELGVICGTIDVALEDKYRALEGVIDISPDTDVTVLNG